MNTRYLSIELRRILRSPRFVIFTIGVPVVMFLVLGPIYGQPGAGGTDAVAYLMVSMAAFGAVSASVNSGALVAQERGRGWNRLLRLTPLRPGSYVVTKVVVSLAVAAPAIGGVYALGGLVQGVRLSPGAWFGSAALMLLGIVPFALIGVLIGYLGTPTSAPAIGAAVFLGLSLFGGLWFPVEIMPSFMGAVAHVVPSYWLGQLSRGPLAGEPVDIAAVAWLLAWTVVIAALAARAYRRDTART